MKRKFKYLVLLVVTSMSLLAFDLNATSSDQDTIKLFLQDRPPIFKIVFLLTEFTNGIASQPQLYEGGWSKDDFYVKRYVMPGSTNTNYQIDLATNLQSFWGVGKMGNTYWHMTDSNDLTRVEMRPDTPYESNPISAHALNLKLNLDRVLNLGIDLLKTGSVQWNGDSFVAKYEDGIQRIKKITYVIKGQQKTIDNPNIYGQIIRENDQVTSIKITDYSTNFRTSYILDCRYDLICPLPKRLPNTILRSRIIGPFNKSEPLEGVEILSIELSNTNRPTIAYTINNYVESTNSYNILFSNNQYYTFSSNRPPQLLNFNN
jgi:hypothetical protein